MKLIIGWMCVQDAKVLQLVVQMSLESQNFMPKILGQLHSL
jgi:hypothetical protein